MAYRIRYSRAITVETDDTELAERESRAGYPVAAIEEAD